MPTASTHTHHGKVFEREVAQVYRLLGFSVTENISRNGMQLDLEIEKRDGGLLIHAVVECKDSLVNSDDRDQILAQQNILQKTAPSCRWVVVTSTGFASATRAALESAGIACLTYADLIRELVPLDAYTKQLVLEYRAFRDEHWAGGDWFVPPRLASETGLTHESAVDYIEAWASSAQHHLLVILGDLGTGKTTLCRTVAYRLALRYLDAPHECPAPVLISLKDVRKAIDLEGIVLSHFINRGLSRISFQSFEHLVKLGKAVLIFDAFDEMADRVRWDETKKNFAEIRRAATTGGKAIVTCRTHYFRDELEKAGLVTSAAQTMSTRFETDLYAAIKGAPDVDICHVTEFDSSQVEQYVSLARPHTAVGDLRTIRSVYDLAELAHRPLLLDMIVKSLPQLAGNGVVNAASLYRVYIAIWLDREDSKGRVLNRELKLALMHELARRLWHEREDAIHYESLLPFVESLASESVVDLGDELSDDVVREIQMASFLRWSNGRGLFEFVHRSFMEYFLAERIWRTLSDNDAAITAPLNTHRFNPRIAYFVALLDEDSRARRALQRVLTLPYQAQVSENALQLLYWGARVSLKMEAGIADRALLQRELPKWIPDRAQLRKAKLQGMNLEAIVLHQSDLRECDLTDANLSHARINQSFLGFSQISMCRVEGMVASNSSFRRCKGNPLDLQGASLADCDTFEAFVTEQS